MMGRGDGGRTTRKEEDVPSILRFMPSNNAQQFIPLQKLDHGLIPTSSSSPHRIRRSSGLSLNITENVREEI